MRYDRQTEQVYYPQNSQAEKLTTTPFWPSSLILEACSSSEGDIAQLPMSVCQKCDAKLQEP